MSYPSEYRLSQLAAQVDEECPQACINGEWVPARPLGHPSLRNRLRLAWAVFTGRGDVVYWPKGQ